MAEQKGHSEETISKGVAPETTDRGCGLFNFMGKKEEDKAHDDVVDTKANVEEPEEKHTLMEKLRRTHSNSSSSSDEEEVEAGGTGEKKRKKKGLKDKIKEKMSSSDHNKEDHDSSDKQKIEFIPIDNSTPHVANANAEATHEEEKKGFVDKIKEKLPGHHNKTDQEVNAPAHHSTVDDQIHGGETKEKKGLLDKIKEKLPGHGHNNNEDEEKQKSN